MLLLFLLCLFISQFLIWVSSVFLSTFPLSSHLFILLIDNLLILIVSRLFDLYLFCFFRSYILHSFWLCLYFNLFLFLRWGLARILQLFLMLLFCIFRSLLLKPELFQRSLQWLSDFFLPALLLLQLLEELSLLLLNFGHKSTLFWGILTSSCLRLSPFDLIGCFFVWLSDRSRRFLIVYKRQ